MLAAFLLTSLSVPPASQPVLPPPGSRGYGLTVFKGTAVERFNITVLGTARRALRGSDMLLIRVDNTSLNRFRTGIVAGMSGSPIYVEGRLVGALAYGWSGSQEPIGGVTPISSMHSLSDSPQASSSAELSLPLQVGERRFRRVVVSGPASADPETLSLSPLAGLLQVKGLDQEGLSRLRSKLGPLGLEPMATPFHGSLSSSGVAPLRPGSAVGIQLMKGDFEMATTGTLTWRQGNRILAFGHSFAQLGPVDLPLTASYISTVHPSYQRPFKMASQLAIVGSLQSDRYHAVEGQLHQPSQMVPLTMTINGHDFKAKVAQHPKLTATLVGSALYQALSTQLPDLQDQTARLRVAIRPAGSDPFKIDLMASGTRLNSRLGDQIEAMLGPLINNSIDPLPLAALAIEATLEPKREVVTITGASSQRTTYQPGELVNLKVALQPQEAAPYSETISLRLPTTTADGTVKIALGGGHNLPALHKKIGHRSPTAQSSKNWISYLRQRPRGDQLVAICAAGSHQLYLDGLALPSLPEPWRAWLKSNSTALSPSPLVEAVRDQKAQVEGSSLVTIKVAKKKPPSPKPLWADLKKKPKRPAANRWTRLPSSGYRWSVRSFDHWREGELEGLKLSNHGKLSLGYTPQTVASLGLATSLHGPWIGWSNGEITGPQQFSRAGGMVTALLAQDDELWAGLSPGGALIRLTPSPAQYQLPCRYIWDLEPTEEGLLVACGDPARLYRVTGKSQPRLLFEAPDLHLTALQRVGDTFYLGSAPAGQLWRWRPSSPQLLASYSQGISALAVWKDQLLIAVGDLITDLDDRRLKLPAPLVKLAAGPDKIWATTTDGTYEIDLERSRFTFLEGQGGLDLIPNSSGLRIAGQGATDWVPAKKQGHYLSETLDATRPARWGSARWSPTQNSQTSLQTRTGPTPEPDSSWSAWSGLLSSPTGSAIDSPPGRYLQFRSLLQEGDLEAVDITFRPVRGQPQARWLSPLGGERWSQAQTLQFELTQGSPDDLSYRLSASTDEQEWRPISTDQNLTGSYNQVTWKTTELPSGWYVLKLELLRGQQTVFETRSNQVLVSHEPPQLAWVGKKGLARSGSGVAIVEVLYRVGQGSWHQALAVDGLFDSPREEFLIPLPSGTSVSIQARDEIGHTARLERRL